MADEFNFFESSPFLDPSFRANFPSGFSLPLTEGFFWDIVNKKNLFRDLVEAYKGGQSYFNYHFPNYFETIKTTGTQLLTASSTNISKLSKDPYSFLDFVQVEVTTKSDRIDMIPYLSVIPNPNSLYAEYRLFFVFTDDVDVEEWDLQLVVVLSQDASSGVIGKYGKKSKALQFKTNLFWIYERMVNKFPYDFSRVVIDAFDKEFGMIEKTDFNRKRNLYWQAPKFYLETFTLDDLYYDFKGFLDLDREWFDESNGTMLKVLEIIISKEGGLEHLYASFNKDPWRLKTTYDQLDGTSTRNGIQYPNKTILASLMMMLCNYKNQGLNEARKHRDIVFRIDKTHKIDSNVVSDDSNPNYFDLQQMVYRKGEYYDVTFGKVDRFDWFESGKTYSLHPLDIITLIVKDENGIDTPLHVPAIFAKDLAYVQEWEEISKAIRIGVDIFMIVFSAVTLVTGAGFLFTTLALADLGLATGDLTIQAFEDEIRKLPGGSEFLDTWEKAFIVGGLITALPSLLVGGARLMGKIVSVEGRTQMVAMLKYALQSTKAFSNFIDDTFLIVTDYAIKLGKGTAPKMKLLANEGVLLIEGTLKGEKESKLFLSYEGNIIAERNSNKISKVIDDLFREGSEGIENYLRKADADPTFRVWGAGKASHPKEWNAIIKDLKSKGVIIKFSERNMSYGPNPSPGKPGTIVITPDSSITALMHEAQHFYDDMALGFPGWEKTVYDPQVRWNMEFKAYKIEIDFLKRNNEFSTAEELIKNARLEKEKISSESKTKLK